MAQMEQFEDGELDEPDKIQNQSDNETKWGRTHDGRQLESSKRIKNYKEKKEIPEPELTYIPESNLTISHFSSIS